MLLALIFPYHTVMDDIVWLVHILFIWPPAGGRLDCFPAFAITNNVAVNTFYICVCVCDSYQELL